jgi:hypothetical protein
MSRYALLFQLETLRRFQELKTFDFLISERTRSDSRYIFAENLYLNNYINKNNWAIYVDAYEI